MTDDTFPIEANATNQTVNYGKNFKKSKILKRGFDMIGASAGLVLLAPLLFGLAILIKLTSKGPVLFRQERHGLNGEVFVAYKFRSMYVDQCDHSGVRQTVRDDPRITPIGRFLRRSNFDELPQLLNVLTGHMSLVGPRPHVPGMLANGVPYETFDSRYHSRHRVKPGITGLAQVNGFRGETRDAHAARMRLHLDLEYIETHSVLLDAKIIAKTVVIEFFQGKGY
ncbi:sugar transferase [Roseibium aggregatum]|uniref:Sugar transferase n=1 Tax=Roseibium aggregatum TaxID=187304 RepID=A0A939EAK3_9HYPH|nr:sugar transferase [Roseibium aggregatum]MBN9669856.1 sugar transferase [Roseibium aggregatum]